ncbi:hypothetical protein ACKWTF_004708 [Chironomus riparius]
MRAFFSLFVVFLAFTSGYKFYDEFQNDISSHSFNDGPMSDSVDYYSDYKAAEQFEMKLQTMFRRILDKASKNFITEIELGMSKLVEDYDLRVVKIIVNGKDIMEFFDIMSKQFSEILEDVIPSIKIEFYKQN